MTDKMPTSALLNYHPRFPVNYHAASTLCEFTFWSGSELHTLKGQPA
ncbi:hypothetical protein [Deinococcus proteolyticus]|nr:hypothetical protein [Deinococcus proteolyticus]